MSFPSSSTTVPNWTPVTVSSGITYSVGRWNFYVGVDGTTVVGKVNVGVTDGSGFRIEKVKANGPDLITCTINLAAAVQALL